MTNLGKPALRCEQAQFTPIPGWPDYAASSDGRIWAVGTNWRGYGARELAAHPDRHGYLGVRLTSSGRRTKFKVHRLICETFHGPRPEGRQARHLDGDKLNNRAENLAWGTVAENAADRTAHGRYFKPPWSDPSFRKRAVAGMHRAIAERRSANV